MAQRFTVEVLDAGKRHLQKMARQQMVRGLSNAALLILREHRGELAAMACYGIGQSAERLGEKVHRIVISDIDADIYREIKAAHKQTGVQRSRLAGAVIVGHFTEEREEHDRVAA